MSTTRTALISNGVVTNVMLGGDTLTAAQLGCDSLVPLTAGQSVSPGDLYNGSTFTRGPVDPALTNQNTMKDNAVAAISQLRAYAALASPTNAQTVTAAQLLARVDVALIRFLLGQFDGTN